jgi:hypothetical protein
MPFSEIARTRDFQGRTAGAIKDRFQLLEKRLYFGDPGVERHELISLYMR